MKTYIGINGACGRMGQRLVHLIRDDHRLELAAALEAPDHPEEDRDIGEVCGLGTLGVPVRSALHVEQRIDVMIDFSSPAGSRQALAVCVPRRIPLVVATTGHTTDEK